jgi:hypothetical protein
VLFLLTHASVYMYVPSYVCLEYIRDLDINALLSKLSVKVTLTQDCIFLLKLAHHLLKKGIADGLTLWTLANVMGRSDDITPSQLETIIRNAEDNAFVTIESRVGRLGSPPPVSLDTRHHRGAVDLRGAKDFGRIASVDSGHGDLPSAPGPPPVVGSTPPAAPPLISSPYRTRTAEDMWQTLSTPEEKHISDSSDVSDESEAVVSFGPEAVLSKPRSGSDTMDDAELEELKVSAPPLRKMVRYRIQLCSELNFVFRHFNSHTGAICILHI